MAVPLSRPAPGPAGYPFVGVFPNARRDPMGFLMECARRYGDVTAMRFGRRRIHLLSHPDHVKRVLQDRASIYAKGPPAKRARGLFGDSLTVTDGDRWHRRRRALQPAFQSAQLVRFASIVTEAAGEMLDGWRRRAERSEPVDAAAEMRRLAQTIIVRACFGEVREADLETLRRALETAVGHVESRLWSAFAWLEAPTPAAVRYRRALGVIEAWISSAVRRARRSAPSPGSLLAALIPPTGSGEPLTDGELREELKAILVAGHTTVASALAWTWYALSKHPEVRARVEEECRAVLGRDPPDVEALAGLGYTRRVIAEVLRRHPPTWITARMAVEDDALAGYAVPAGAVVLLSPYVNHRHPAVWEAPERFDPDRFLPARASGRPGFAYFPFGGGPRRCIGRAFATTEIELVVAAVTRRYRLTPISGARVEPLAALTLRPSPGLPCSLDRTSAG